jgi:uncharacterized membrane protein
MTDADARNAADLIVASAVVAAAYVVLTKPPLRRLAFAAVRHWLGASVPFFLLTQAREAWAASDGRHA